MNLFYYTERKKVENEDEMDYVNVGGYSFNLDEVASTNPKDGNLEVCMKQNSDILHPVEFTYAWNKTEGKKTRTGVKKFEVLSQPLMHVLTNSEEIKRFYSLTNGPESFQESN